MLSSLFIVDLRKKKTLVAERRKIHNRLSALGGAVRTVSLIGTNFGSSRGTYRTLPYTIRFVGLLGSHSLGINPKFMDTTVALGRELLRRKIKLAYGGGSVGLQGAVASTVFTNGGLVRGFIPGYIATRRVYGPTYGVEHTVSSNYYKYFEMNHAMEAFIVLPGGVDTMEDDAVRQNFMASSQRKLFISSFSVDELLDKLEFAKAFPGPGRSDRLESGSLTSASQMLFVKSILIVSSKSSYFYETFRIEEGSIGFGEELRMLSSLFIVDLRKKKTLVAERRKIHNRLSALGGAVRTVSLIGTNFGSSRGTLFGPTFSELHSV
ncbi:hypothetical protein DM860_013824 [Cuscuta australis]|uniref:Cytokinin riboside 5'-monophosphate phosphoribohydrolase n=1 Tax=Cuscuta australis TaxID=267555 RepID=A0A328DLA3_9ASTE|nr:hypothetical protein DM860_013824 [Cuscuta australis]